MSNSLVSERTEAARLQSELQDLQRERRQVAPERALRAVHATRDPASARCARGLVGVMVTLNAHVQAELKLRAVAPLRAPGPVGRVAPDRDARDRGGHVFDRDGVLGGRGPVGADRGGLQGRMGGDLRSELRRGDLRGELGRGDRGRGEVGGMDRDGRGGGSERPRAPHPWDPTPKILAPGAAKPARMLIQSAITKRAKEDDEAPNDEDDEDRRRKRGREDDEEEDEGVDDDAVDKAEPSSMRMDKPEAGYERVTKSRRISAESADGDRERDMRRDRDGDRDRRRDGARDREVRTSRDQRAAAADSDKKEAGEGGGRAGGSSRVEVKSRNKRMFGGLLGHLKKAKKEEETLSQSESIKKR